MFGPDVYATLTSLSIHEFYWPGPEDHPNIPSLTMLRVLLASCRDVVAAHYSIAGIFQATSESSWNLPGVQTLHLTYWLASPCDKFARACCCSDRLTISLADVHSFVARCLQPSDRRLANITLSGVEVIDRLPETWLERIGELCDEFTLSQTCTPTSADAPRRVWDGEFEDMFWDNLTELCE
ncbi:hypothetical protein AURDEDRAFT_157997 [Auricularia subglabra TFB-10046 SS5]|nr:hypothetical protein AURDEDRAFT_157997 [Auricularia subglabra TFB-10046 SS5]